MLKSIPVIVCRGGADLSVQMLDHLSHKLSLSGT